MKKLTSLLFILAIIIPVTGTSDNTIKCNWNPGLSNDTQTTINISIHQSKDKLGKQKGLPAKVTHAGADPEQSSHNIYYLNIPNPK